MCGNLVFDACPSLPRVEEERSKRRRRNQSHIYLSPWFSFSLYIFVSKGNRGKGIMGRPPCCDKAGVKKGPWTPEEDIILVTYIQEHGPGNWRAVPTNTGLLRCSKSCRLRWTNYLRPGIKRGNFTEQEEKLIIHLQALLGNRWAAISSYLPERTDNDIKNYWNTHLRKKLKKLQTDANDPASHGRSSYQPTSKGQWERRLQTDIHTAKQALCQALSLESKPNCLPDHDDTSNGSNLNTWASTYPSSTENISKLLEGWMRKSPRSLANSSSTQAESSSSQMTASNANYDVSLETLELSFGFDSATPEGSETSLFGDEGKPGVDAEAPLFFLESWLLDDDVGQVHEGLLDIPLIDPSELF